MSLPATSRSVNKNIKIHDPKAPMDVPHIIRVWIGFVVVASSSWLKIGAVYGKLWDTFLLLPRSYGAYRGGWYHE